MFGFRTASFRITLKSMLQEWGQYIWKTNNSPVLRVARNLPLQAKSRNFIYPRDSRSLKSANPVGMLQSKHVAGDAAVTAAVFPVGRGSYLMPCAPVAGCKPRCLSSRKVQNQSIAGNALTPAEPFPLTKQRAVYFGKLKKTGFISRLFCISESAYFPPICA